jgi:thiosulfate/3-mercaptopyruvate sulfurtransferase
MLVTLFAAATLAGAPGPQEPAPRIDSSMVVTPAWLAKHLNDPKVVVVEITMASMGEKTTEHIPGARSVEYHDLITSVGNVNSELPAVDQLVNVFSTAGVGTQSTVVLYGGAPPLVTRAFFTLDYLGNTHPAVLIGGIQAWKAEGHPIVAEFTTPPRATLVPHPNPAVVAKAAWVRERLGHPAVAIIDTRTPAEYFGGGERHGTASLGHIPGARRLEWEELFNPTEGFALRSPRELQALLDQRAKPGDTVVTYCTVGYRASATYFLARYLGHPVKLYDGSYEEWSALGLPIARDTVPLLKR